MTTPTEAVDKDQRIADLERVLGETTDVFRRSTDDCTAACSGYKAEIERLATENKALREKRALLRDTLLEIIGRR